MNEARVRDPKVICAALLHDTVEDTETTPEELQAHFGRAVRDIVLEVTDDKNLPKAERKRLQIVKAKGLSRRAKLVKLADKICNLRDIAESPPADWDLKRQQEYYDWAKRVSDRLRGAHPRLEAAFDMQKDATNLEAALKLAQASFAEDTARCIVIALPQVKQ